MDKNISGKNRKKKKGKALCLVALGLRDAQNILSSNISILHE
jgi:hypothetical protein